MPHALRCVYRTLPVSISAGDGEHLRALGAPRNNGTRRRVFFYGASVLLLLQLQGSCVSQSASLRSTRERWSWDEWGRLRLSGSEWSRWMGGADGACFAFPPVPQRKNICGELGYTYAGYRLACAPDAVLLASTYLTYDAPSCAGNMTAIVPMFRFGEHPCLC